LHWRSDKDHHLELLTVVRKAIFWTGDLPLPRLPGAASKHGVLGLVRSAAAELATTGVTVNAVCPGYVDTPMTDTTVDTIVAATGRTAEQARETLERKQPIGRLITPAEVADAVWFCVRNGAVTGQGVNVDGGSGR
jgi:NAD(P)-dependent dehydrogenase (short-subunit alcohol dehydrogenase family)